MNDKLIEILSENEHNRWSNWQKYLHSKCMSSKYGYIIPKLYVKNLNKLINTKYNDLSEEQKENDRKEVKKILKIIENFNNKEGIKYD